MGNSNNKQEEEIKPKKYFRHYEQINYSEYYKKYVAQVKITDWTLILGFYDTEKEAYLKVDDYYRNKYNIPPVENPVS